MTSFAVRRTPRSIAARLLAALICCSAGTASWAATELDRIVVVVNNDVVLESEIEAAIDQARSQLIARGIGVPPLSALRDQVTDRLILSRLQSQLAQQAGIRIGDKELNDVIRRIAAQNNVSAEQFAAEIEADGISFADVREQIREEVMISRIRQREVDSRVVVTDQDVDRFLEREGADSGAEYRLAHILIPLRDGATPKERSAAQARANEVLGKLRDDGDFSALAAEYSAGQQALSGGDLGWRGAAELPETFVRAANTLTPGQISGLLETSAGYNIIKVTEKRGSGPRRTVVESHARHILIMPDTIVSEDAARAQIRDLHERIKAGEDFADLARDYSDDPGSKNAGGDLSWLPPGVLVPEFQAEVDALQPGAMSEPFHTQFGWHIVQLIERRTRDVTEQSRRAEARATLEQRKGAEEYELWKQRLRDEAYIEFRSQAKSAS